MSGPGKKSRVILSAMTLALRELRCRVRLSGNFPNMHRATHGESVAGYLVIDVVDDTPAISVRIEDPNAPGHG
jgi:hypothetical protein